MNLLTINLATGFIAVCLMALVLRGLWGHMVARHKDGSAKRFRDMDAGDLMRFGTGLYHVKGLLRIGSWDLLVPGFWLLTTVGYGRAPYVAIINTGFALLAIFGSLMVLAAFHRNIPKEERGGYNWLSSAFHPNPPPLIFRGWRK